MTRPTSEDADSARSEAESRIPLVSVVIICYNHGRFLTDAIESVFAQTMNDLEVVLVDDGSTDDTPAVAARYPSVRYLRQRNQGPAAARNTGLRASRGCYVSFLDADDRLLPEALNAGTACMRQHPECAFVSGHYRMIGIGGESIPSESRPCVTMDHYRAFLEGNYVGMHATVLFRREALESVSGFDRSMRAGEDYDIYLRIARRSRVYCHDQTVAEYRWHGANTSRNWRLMLRTVRPLRAQWKYVRGEERLENSYRKGICSWQKLYGVPLLQEVLGDLRRPARIGSALLGLLTLLRYYPSALTRPLAQRVRGAGTGRRG